MKKIVSLILASLIAVSLTSCGADDTIPPSLDVAENIFHNQNEKFDITKYCSVEDDSGSAVSLKYEGDVNVTELGDNKIKVIAEDKAENKTEQEVVVTVKKSKKKLSNDAICKSVREFIFAFIAGGHDNIDFRGYSDDVGFFSKAYSKSPNFKLNDKFDGTLSFEAIQYEDYKASVLNLVFSIDSDAMWYYPTKVKLSNGSENLEFDVSQTFQAGKNYGIVVPIGELNIKKDLLTPDYNLIETLKNMLGGKKTVKLTAIGETDSLEIELADNQKKDFADILTIYEELVTYY